MTTTGRLLGSGFSSGRGCGRSCSSWGCGLLYDGCSSCGNWLCYSRSLNDGCLCNGFLNNGFLDGRFLCNGLFNDRLSYSRFLNNRLSYSGSLNYGSLNNRSLNNRFFSSGLLDSLHLLHVGVIVDDDGLEGQERLVDSIAQRSIGREADLGVRCNLKALTCAHIHTFASIDINNLKGAKTLNLD